LAAGKPAQKALETRAYDAVLIRALLEENSAASSNPALLAKIVLVDLTRARYPRSHHPISDWAGATELRVRLPSVYKVTDKHKRQSKLCSMLLAHLKQTIEGGKLCRITLLFPTPPTPEVIRLANTIAAVAKGHVSVDCAWLWRGGEDNSARLDEAFQSLPPLSPNQWRQES
jgi:hypothetical protein